MENLDKQAILISEFLVSKLAMFKQKCELSVYKPKIIKSGIDFFSSFKLYIDTSCIQSVNSINSNEAISYNKRPSRANMQPKANSIWFAKMKDSNKILIVSDADRDIIENNILSTGFCGISESDNLSLTLLVAFVISPSFKIQRDLNSVGTTMAGVNNETLLKIEVPFLSKEENKEFDHRYRPLVNNLSLIRRKINLLKREKEILLKIFF